MTGVGAMSLSTGLAIPAIAQNNPIRMGWIAAVSGMFPSNVQARDWGFHMAVTDPNEQGGLLRRKVEAVMRDSPADPSKAVSFAWPTRAVSRTGTFPSSVIQRSCGNRSRNC